MERVNKQLLERTIFSLVSSLGKYFVWELIACDTNSLFHENLLHVLFLSYENLSQLKRVSRSSASERAVGRGGGWGGESRTWFPPDSKMLQNNMINMMNNNQ